ncbi:F-box protein SKIP23 [Medicago truncatula]|uniref:F-box protein SKIP23 n=1 Tax=Medicago truncatula TaxID=3880 RepID=UPI000D2F1DDD|nr:F-box protein SKIP23 [Medicago truncatula]
MKLASSTDNGGRLVTTFPFIGVFKGDKSFLVECDGDLLLVVQYLSKLYVSNVDGEEIYNGAVRFKVFKLDEKMKMWVEMRNLGDRVLFLGEDSAFPVLASNLCIANGNCVIFRDDILRNVRPTDLGISFFHLDQCRTLPLSDFPSYAKLFWPPPEWVGMCIDNSRVCVLD